MAETDKQAPTAAASACGLPVDNLNSSQLSVEIVCVDGEWFWLKGEYPVLPEGPFASYADVESHTKADSFVAHVAALHSAAALAASADHPAGVAP